MYTRKISYLKYLIRAMLFVSCLFIISCSNFLNSKSVAEDIKKTIAYNNAPECNVLFKSDASYGSFLTGETLILKVGFETQVQFKVNKNDYIFTGLEAVSKSNADESLADYVVFTNKETDEEKGIYKINVKVTKNTSDLMICPVCLAYPAVSSYSPSSKEPQFANMPIVINFNIPMVNEDTGTTVEINYDNLLITAGGSPLNNYFEAPVFNENKTKLTLTPKANDLKAYITRLQADFIEVQIVLTENITVNYQNQIFAIKQDKNSNFIIKYKAEIDNTAPQRIDFFCN